MPVYPTCRDLHPVLRFVGLPSMNRSETLGGRRRSRGCTRGITTEIEEEEEDEEEEDLAGVCVCAYCPPCCSVRCFFFTVIVSLLVL